MIKTIPKIEFKEIDEKINERVEKNLKLLEESKDYKDIKEKLDKGNNLIDYFLVIGQEPIIYREKWLYTEDVNTLNEKYKEQYYNFNNNYESKRIKKYYVRIRTYKTVNGKKFYSGWSKVLNVKTMR